MSFNKHLEEHEDEKKNKRRGLIIAFFVNVGLIILTLIPWPVSEQELPPKEIIIEFANYVPPEPEVEEIPFDESGSSEPDNPLGDTEDAMEQEAAPEPETPAEPDPTPSEPEVVEETTPEPAPEAPTETATQPEPSEVSAPETPPTETTPKPPKPPKPTAPSDKPSKPTKPTKPSTGSDSNTSTDSGNSPGKPGTPTGTDDGTSSGNNGSGGDSDGTGSGDGSGHGFNRKVDERPTQSEIKAIAQGKTGKVHVDVCINQMGKVVSADSNKAKSSLKDDVVLQKAEYLAKKYRFEKDFKAPTKQCWYLVFSFREDKGENRLIPQPMDQIIFID